jgi:ketosteroid isomerase-like protein
MDRDEQAIHQISNDFNARDAEAAFALLTDDLVWANGMGREQRFVIPSDMPLTGNHAAT